MMTAVELHEFGELRGRPAALAMRGSTTFSGRAQAVLAEQSAKGFATEGETLVFHKFLAKVVIVEARVRAACQPQDALTHSSG
jgi:hypothetical protein